MDTSIVVNLLLKAADYRTNMDAAEKQMHGFKEEAKTASTEVQKLEVTLKSEASAAKTAAETMANLQKSTASMEASSKQLADAAQKLATSLQQTHQQAKRTDEGMGSLAGVVGVAKGAFEAFVGVETVKYLAEVAAGTVEAAEKMNQLRISTAAVVAANEKIYDSGGRLVTGTEKIQLAMAQTSGVFAQLQIDAIKTTDTTAALIEKFQAMAPAALAAGISLDQTRKLTLAFSATTSALRIHGQQARVEIKDLFEGVRLGTSALAISLGVKKQDIDLAKQQGKLYEYLIDKTKDYVAANHLQARTLTKAKSSLEDLQGILQRITGETADQTLTEGFGRVLDAVVNADGSLTDFGQTLEHLAASTGVLVDEMARDFNGLLGPIERVINAMAPLAARAAGMMRAVQAAGDLRDRIVIHEGMPVRAGDLMDRAGKLQADMSVNPFNPDLSAAVQKRRNDDAIELGHINASLKQAARAIAPGFGADMERLGLATKGSTKAALRRTDRDRLLGVSSVGPTMGEMTGTGGHRYVPNPRRHEIPKAHHGRNPAIAADSSRIQNVMRDMEEALHVSDRNASIAALTSDNAPVANDERKLEILKRYRHELVALHVTQQDRLKQADQVHQIDRKIADEEATKTLDIARATKERADKQNALNVALKEGAAQQDDAKNVREMAHIKAVTAVLEKSLKDRYEHGEINARDYYTHLAMLREGDLAAETAVERKKLQNQHATLEEQFAIASGKHGKSYSPAEVAKLRAALAGNASALAGLGGQQADKSGAIQAEASKGIKDATERGLNDAVSAVFGLSLDPIKSSAEASFKQGVVDALASTSVGQALGELFSASGAIGGLTGGIVDAGLHVINLVQAYGAANTRARQAGFGALQSITDAINPIQGVKDQAESARQGQITDIMNGNQADKGVFGFLSPRGMSADQWSAVNSQYDRTVTQGSQAVGASSAQQGMAYNETMRAAGKETVQGEIDGIRAMVKAFDLSGEERTALEIKIAELTKQKVTEVADARKAIEADGAAAIEATWRDTFAAIDQRQQESANAWLANLQKMKTANQDAANAAKTTLDVGVLGQNLSKAQGALVNAKADEAARKAERQALYDSSGDAQRKMAALRGQFEGSDGAGPLTFTATNAAGAAALKQKWDPFNGIRSKQMGADNVNFASDLDRFTKMAASGSVVIRDASGNPVTAEQLRAAADAAAQLPAKLASVQGQLPGAESAVAQASQAVGVQQATVNAATAAALKPVGQSTTGLAHELAVARAYGNKGAQRALAMSDVDAQITAKRQELFQSGALTDATPQADRDKLNDQLAQLSSALKDQVNKQYSEANPLPVHVVNLPPLFALPDSEYFRAPAAPTLNLHPGAIQVNGSGLGPEALQHAVTAAIAEAGPALVLSVNRQNTVNNARVTTA